LAGVVLVGAEAVVEDSADSAAAGAVLAAAAQGEAGKDSF
jgi:hypothetical protein